jgi:hypothetical protein
MTLTLKARIRPNMPSDMMPTKTSGVVSGKVRGEGTTGVIMMAKTSESPAFHMAGIPLAPKRGKRKKRILMRTRTQKNPCICSNDSMGNAMLYSLNLCTIMSLICYRIISGILMIK